MCVCAHVRVWVGRCVRVCGGGYGEEGDEPQGVSNVAFCFALLCGFVMFVSWAIDIHAHEILLVLFAVVSKKIKKTGHKCVNFRFLLTRCTRPSATHCASLPRRTPTAMRISRGPGLGRGTGGGKGERSLVTTEMLRDVSVGYTPAVTVHSTPLTCATPSPM